MSAAAEIAEIIRGALLDSGLGEELEIAQEWVDSGFTADEVKQWAESRTWEPWAAAQLRDRGVTPEQAATVIDGGYSDTLGYKVSNKDIDTDEAKAILNSYERQGRL